LRVREFEWDEGNEPHIELGHGISADEAEEVLARSPLVRRAKHGHYVAFGQTIGGRMLTIVFEYKGAGLARVITGWDMSPAERRYYRSRRRDS
jgi:uncharacterized DUF497 family protein